MKCLGLGMVEPLFVTGPIGVVVWMLFSDGLFQVSTWIWSQFHLWSACLHYGTCPYYTEVLSPVEMNPSQLYIKYILIWVSLFAAGYWQWFILLPWLIRKIFDNVATRLEREHRKHSDKDIYKSSSAKEIVAPMSPVLRFMAMLIHSCILVLYFYYLVEMWVYVANDYISPDLRIYYTHPFIYVLIFKVLFFAMILFIQNRLKYFSLYLLSQSMLSMFLGVFVIFNAYSVSILYICCILWLMISNYRKYF